MKNAKIKEIVVFVALSSPTLVVIVYSIISKFI